jgi:hypothetical protein
MYLGNPAALGYRNILRLGDCPLKHDRKRIVEFQPGKFAGVFRNWIGSGGRLRLGLEILAEASRF